MEGSILSVSDRDDDDDNHRMSLVTSEHDYTMLLSQMDQESNHNENNNILNGYHSDGDSYHSNEDDVTAELCIPANDIDNDTELDKSPKYVDIQLGIDLSIPSDTVNKDGLVSSEKIRIIPNTNNNDLDKSDPILASTTAILLTNSEMQSIDHSSHFHTRGGQVHPMVNSIALPAHRNSQQQCEDTVIQLAPPMQPISLKVFYPTEVNSTDIFECQWESCSKKCGSLTNLVDHVNDEHVRLGYGKEMEYKCLWRDCPRRGKGFNARYKMLIHTRTHTKEKPHRCSQCGKSFSRLENLKIHTRSHTGERPYVCPVDGCNKSYSNSSDRFKHVRTHTEERPYWCRMPGCMKRYTDPSSLRKHIKTNGHYFRHSTEENIPVSENSQSSMDSFSNPSISNEKSDCESVPTTVLRPQPQIIQCPLVMAPLTQSETVVLYNPSPNGANIIHSPLATHMSVISVQNLLPPRLSANPLLSSTMIRTCASQHPIMKDSLLVCTHNIPESPVKDLQPDTEAKDQEAPLDLSTSPTQVLEREEHHLNNGFKPKWEIMQMDD